MIQGELNRNIDSLSSLNLITNPQGVFSNICFIQNTWISDLLPSPTFVILTHLFIWVKRDHLSIKTIYNDHCAFLVTGCRWWQNALWWLHYQHWSSGKLVIHLRHTWHVYCGLLCQHTHINFVSIDDSLLHGYCRG